MGQIHWWYAAPALAVAGWLALRRPVRLFVEEMHVERARELFRQQREWLEARFLTALGKVEPFERLRWEDAQWHDEVLWARDRKTRSFLALIGVHFLQQPYEASDPDGDPPRHSTALFEYRKGRWYADGKRLDQVRPDEAVLHHHWFEPVATQPRRAV